MTATNETDDGCDARAMVMANLRTMLSNMKDDDASDDANDNRL